MNEFNLYCLTNFDAEQLINPLKRTTLLLGFIKGPNVLGFEGKGYSTKVQ